MPMTPMTSFRLHADQRAALTLIAGRRGCTRTDLIREAIDLLVIAAEDQENAPPAGNGRRAEKLAEKERGNVQATAT